MLNILSFWLCTSKHHVWTRDIWHPSLWCRYATYKSCLPTSTAPNTPAHWDCLVIGAYLQLQRLWCDESDCGLHTCMSHLSVCSAAERWYKRHLTYQIVNWPRHLPLGSVRLAVRAAFQLWSNVSGLVFQEAPEGPADIRLAFYEGDHNDGANNAFDGPGQGHHKLTDPICVFIYKTTQGRFVIVLISVREMIVLCYNLVSVICSQISLAKESYTLY